MNLKCLFGHDWDGHTNENYPPPKCKQCGKWHKRKKRCKDYKWLYKCTHGHLFKTSNGEVVFLNSQTNMGKSVCPYYERERWKIWRPK